MDSNFKEKVGKILDRTSLSQEIKDLIKDKLNDGNKEKVVIFLETYLNELEPSRQKVKKTELEFLKSLHKLEEEREKKKERADINNNINNELF